MPPTASAFLIASLTLSSDLPAMAASSLVSSRLSSLAGAAVAGGQDDRVVLEDLVLLQQAFERLRGGDAVEEPERVPDLVAQLGGGERVLLVGRQRVEELDDLGLVLEVAVVLGAEELGEVEGVVDVRLVLLDGDTLGEVVGDHARQLIGEQVERRQRGVRVVLRAVRPLAASGLLVLVRPVEDLVLAEPAGRERLERRARQVKGVAALDLVERDVGLRRVDALVGFVDDEQVPVHLSDVLELGVAAAEVLRPLEVLQRHELDDPRVGVEVLRGVCPPLLARHRGALGQGRGLGDELVGRLVADEPLEVVVPGVGDRRPVRDDERPADVHLPHEVVGRQRLAEPGLGVPEHLALAGPERGDRLRDRCLLFGTELVVLLGDSAGGMAKSCEVKLWM